jgi:hypothetical protein|tara:strand:- start:285 stop:512 length:228 start_codon:yes stop_codon:yes gene_type:complete
MKNLTVISKANYNLKKIENATKKVVIVFTDECIECTFESVKDADLYCYIQNGYFNDQVYYSDEINVLDFNKSLLN